MHVLEIITILDFSYDIFNIQQKCFIYYGNTSLVTLVCLHFLYICIITHTHVHTHTYLHKHPHMHTRICMHSHKHSSTHVRTRPHPYQFTNINNLYYNTNIYKMWTHECYDTYVFTIVYLI